MTPTNFSVFLNIFAKILCLFFFVLSVKDLVKAVVVSQPFPMVDHRENSPYILSPGEKGTNSIFCPIVGFPPYVFD